MLYLKKSIVHFFLLVMIVGMHGHAQAQDKGMSIEDVTRLKSVTSVAISGDGNYIAYTVTDPADPLENNQSGQLHLYVYNHNTGEQTAYYTRGSVSDVSFRPGHEAVTFLARPGEMQVNALYEMPLNGGSPQKIYQFESSISAYQWASD